VKPNQVYVLAAAVFGDFEQIDDTEETGLPCQCRRDIRKTDRLDGIHFDDTFFHTIPAADFDLQTLPDPNAAGDFSTANALPKTLGEDHGVSLHQARKPSEARESATAVQPLNAPRVFNTFGGA
jgi:hypothetical protein